MSETLGSVISRVRTERGMTQRELAKKVEVSNSTISRIEKDDGIHPDPPTLKDPAWCKEPFPRATEENDEHA